jgi:hypothetical protein
MLSVALDASSIRNAQKRSSDDQRPGSGSAIIVFPEHEHLLHHRGMAISMELAGLDVITV